MLDCPARRAKIYPDFVFVFLIFSRSTRDPVSQAKDLNNGHHRRPRMTDDPTLSWMAHIARFVSCTSNVELLLLTLAT